MHSATVLGLTWMTAPVRAQTLSDWKCTGHPDISWDEQIVGCTNAIKSGRYTAKDLAAAFEGRGNAYFGMRDYDHAVADYTETIRLDPKGAYAFYDLALHTKSRVLSTTQSPTTQRRSGSIPITSKPSTIVALST
jgi:tetratricopeptide (TPR) repeat protein